MIAALLVGCFLGLIAILITMILSGIIGILMFIIRKLLKIIFKR